MSNERNSEVTHYEIRILGHLGPEWNEWFGGMTIILEDDGHTLLCGPVVDQAALYGLLKKIRNLGMPLLSINSVKPDQISDSIKDNGEEV